MGRGVSEAVRGGTCLPSGLHMSNRLTVPFRDKGTLQEEDVEILRNPDGSPVVLGTGAAGQVTVADSRICYAAVRPCMDSQMPCDHINHQLGFFPDLVYTMKEC